MKRWNAFWKTTSWRIKENKEEDRLELKEAKSFYIRLKKSA